MTTSPYMPMYWADYEADTAHFTIAEHGAYLMLIKSYWQTGRPIPHDDRLWKIARCETPDEWVIVADAVLKMFDLKKDKLHNKRVEKELKDFRKKSDKKRAAGRVGGQASANKRKSGQQSSSNRQAVVNHTDTDIDIDKEEPPTPVNGKDLFGETPKPKTPSSSKPLSSEANQEALCAEIRNLWPKVKRAQTSRRQVGLALARAKKLYGITGEQMRDACKRWLAVQDHREGGQFMSGAIVFFNNEHYRDFMDGPVPEANLTPGAKRAQDIEARKARDRAELARQAQEAAE